jgi:hypothetical protein
MLYYLSILFSICISYVVKGYYNFLKANNLNMNSKLINHGGKNEFFSHSETFMNSGNNFLSKFSIGDEFKIKITRFNIYGASVMIIDNFFSESDISYNDFIYARNPLGHRRPHFYVSNYEIDMWTSKNKRVPSINEIIVGYVESIDLNKISFSLRKKGYARVTEVADVILNYLLNNSSSQKIDLGKESSSDEIKSLFPFLSKNEFKLATDHLKRLGTIDINVNQINLIPINQRFYFFKLFYCFIN